jgi:hypothetical protein
MDFEQRFFSGTLFVPKPVIEFERASNTLIIATPWGPSEQAQRVIEIIKEQISSDGAPTAETAVTRVARHVEGLSDEGNRLRTATAFANEQLFLRENTSQYTGAVEVAVISIQNQFLSWVQLGSPHILLRNQKGFQPLCYTPDWSWQLHQKSPLVSQALGLERSCYLNCGTHRLQKGDDILLISRSTLPAQIYAAEDNRLESLAHILVDNDPESPFWIGRLKF